MTSEPAENPNPGCPAYGAAEVCELQYSLNTQPGETRQSGWIMLEGICDVRPDRWICASCNFRWYPRKEVEQDLDLLTWQIARPDADTPVVLLHDRLQELREMIGVLAYPVKPD